MLAASFCRVFVDLTRRRIEQLNYLPDCFLFVNKNAERSASARLLKNRTRVRRDVPGRKNVPRRIPTSRRGLRVPFLFSCKHMLSLISFARLRHITWCLNRPPLCWDSEEFRKQFKQEHPNVKAVSAVSAEPSRGLFLILSLFLFQLNHGFLDVDWSLKVGKAGGEKWKSMTGAVSLSSSF